MCKQTSGLMVKQRSSRSLGSIIFAVFALAALGGCMGMSNRPPSVAPPPIGPSSPVHAVPQQHVAAIKPKKAPPRDAAPADVAPAVRVASIDPHSLLGLDPDGVQKRLGVPAHMHNSALSREWVYSASGCSFSIFFYPNVNSTSFRALKYGSAKDDGESIDSSDVCVRKILTARNNAD